MGGLAEMIALLQMQGEVDEAERLLPPLTDFTEKIAAHGADGATWRYLHAQALALAGRSDAALERLGLAVDSMGMPWDVSYLENDPVFRELRTDPRFKAHVERMRVPPGGDSCASADDFPPLRSDLAAGIISDIGRSRNWRASGDESGHWQTKVSQARHR